ncbi:MAG: tetratricopeptide repeat protein [Acidobacteriota bacterium]
MNAPTDWTSAIAILLGGLVLGALFVYLFSKRKSILRDDLAQKDLEGRRDALVQQLRDTGISDDERQRLESETAEVLRKLDQFQSAPASAKVESAPASAASMTLNPTVKGFLYGALSVAALATLGYFVMREAKPREEGGTVTGNLPPEAQQQAQTQTGQPDAMLTQLVAAVQRDPANLQLRNDLAQAYFERDNMMAVFEQTKIVLEQTPNDARALTLQALVRMSMGEADTAEKMLLQASKNDPTNLDSWVALAWVYTQQKRTKEADAMIAQAAKQSPSDKPRLEELYTQMKAQAAGVGAAPMQSAAGGELPPGHPPVDGMPVPAAAPTPPPAATADARAVTVTLDLDPAARGKQGVLFVMARNPNGGPPYAVKRMMVTSFPTTFTFGQADSMMGQPLPDSFRLEARLDGDGNAATKGPEDPKAMQEGVALGSTVRLALK